MKTRILFSILLYFAFLVNLHAQFAEPQTSDENGYKTIIPEQKQGLLKNVSMIANMRYAFQNNFYDGEYTGSQFRFDQFRMEIKGMVADKVYFRFRNRYTKTPSTQSIDNIFGSVDLAYIKLNLTEKISLSAGKMCADWGAWEFDYNPIDIYEYSDIIEYADNFLTGIGVSYKVNPRNELTFQVLDSRTKSFGELYGEQPHLEESKLPLAFILNWRGSLFDGKFNTIWSYAYHNEARDTVSDTPVGMNYIALGNQLKLNKFLLEFDFKWSDEDLDRTGIVSENVPDSLYPYALENTQYLGYWLHAAYRINDKFNIALVFMLDYAKWMDDNLDPQKTTNDIRTAWGFNPTFEYYPWKNLNLRFYVNWVGRIYDYSDYASQRLGVSDVNTGKICIGFVSPLGIF